MSVMLALSMVCIPVSADEAERPVVSQDESFAIESNDNFIEASFEELLEKAIDNKAQESNVGVIDNASEAEELRVYTYIIQDEVLSVERGTGSKLHAITYASEIVPMSSSGHKYEEAWDGAYAVRAYSTLYYSTQAYNGNTMYCLTKVTGGYSRITGVSVSSQTVAYGMSGVGVSGAVNLSGRKYPTGTTFAYNTGFNKFVTTASSSYIGCTYTLVIKRGTGSYNFSLYNNL